MEIITRKEAKERGLKRYFTGKPCKHGHVAERAVPDGGCVKCNRLRSRAYSQTEERKAYYTAYGKTEKRKAHMRNYKRTESGVRADLRKKLGFEPPEALVKSTWGVRSLKRIIKQAKETQTQ